MSVEGQRRYVDAEIADYFEVCRLRRENAKLKRVAGNRLLLNVFSYLLLVGIPIFIEMPLVLIGLSVLGALVLTIYIVFFDDIEEEKGN